MIFWSTISLLFATAAAAAPVAQNDPSGRWLTADREGVIEIAHCGAALCGRIVGMAEPRKPDGSIPRDPHGTPQCGLTFLRVGDPDEDGVWHGRIDNPDDGLEWHCEIRRAADGLHLRGYLLTPLLGKTQIWTPYDKPVSPDCRMIG